MKIERFIWSLIRISFSPLDRASELISSVDPSQICRVKGKGEILLDLETRKRLLRIAWRKDNKEIKWNLRECMYVDMGDV